MSSKLSASDRALVLVFSDFPLLCSDFRTRNTSRFFALSSFVPSVLSSAPSPANPPVSLRALLLFALLVTNQSIESYLFSEKLKEENAAFYMDIALALSTVYWADKGEKHPDITAYYHLVGVHPDQYHQFLEDRRKSVLGPTLYSAWYGAARNSSDLHTLPPRKSPQPETLPQKAKGNAA